MSELTGVGEFSEPNLIEKREGKGWIFDIQRYSINDGPGIRTTVFFKGCPLRCLWCCNPESHDHLPQLFFFESLCTRCYRCVQACPTGASSVGPSGATQINRDLCKACGTCVKACLSEARSLSGSLMTVDQVLEIVKKDSFFYRNSGGGVTASGGEATAQPEFLQELFKRSQESGIHTALETCGYVRWEMLEKILEHTDLVLFDLKHMDLVRHIELTGIDNKLILRNARRIVQCGKSIRMRIPLIPGCNDCEEDIRAVGEFVSGLGLKAVDILPYHQLGASKYQRLGKAYELGNTKLYEEKEVEMLIKSLESYGLTVIIA